ncbi:hypothetical protein Mapa_001740 [Marchantia paleacea]|nr:hypothetical protein Mapa_001740 [Marchantia paleacea]
MTLMRILISLLMALSSAVKIHGQEFDKVVVCETSAASPFVGDVTQCVDHLTELGNQVDCCLDNCSRSKCTTMATCGSGAVNICWNGQSDCTERCISCSRAGILLNSVKLQCSQFRDSFVQLTGGFLEYTVNGDSYRLSVFNSKDT